MMQLSVPIPMTVTIYIKPLDRFFLSRLFGGQNCNRYFLDDTDQPLCHCAGPPRFTNSESADVIHVSWFRIGEDSTAGSNKREVTWAYCLSKLFAACPIHFVFLQCTLCLSNVHCASPMYIVPLQCHAVLSDAFLLRQCISHFTSAVYFCTLNIFLWLCSAFTDFTMHSPCLSFWMCFDSCLHTVISNVFLHLHLQCCLP